MYGRTSRHSPERTLMKTLASALALGAIAAAVATAVHAAPNADRSGLGHAVFVMTNDANSNEVIAFDRTPYGALGSPHRHDTGGRGSGGTVDPLASQGFSHAERGR